MKARYAASVVRVLALSLAVALSLVSGAALAQVDSPLEEALALHAAGDEAGALELLDRTEREGALTQDELVALRELRVLVTRSSVPRGTVVGASRTDESPSIEHGSDAWPWVALAGAILVVGAFIATAAVAASGVDTTVEGPTIAELRF